MRPIAIDHANVSDDFTDVLVEMELNETDKKKIWEYNQKEGYRFYCKECKVPICLDCDISFHDDNHHFLEQITELFLWIYSLQN